MIRRTLALAPGVLAGPRVRDCDRHAGCTRVPHELPGLVPQRVVPDERRYTGTGEDLRRDRRQRGLPVGWRLLERQQQRRRSRRSDGERLDTRRGRRLLRVHVQVMG